MKINRLNNYIRNCKVYYQKHYSNLPIIKVVGLLRTGTNYVTRLIDINFNVFCLNSEEEGWKHGPCNYNDRYYFVFITKDPYSWIISFKEWEEIHHRSDASKTIKDFMIDPITHNKLKSAWHASNPVDAWNKAIQSWNGYSDKNNTIFIRYEDLLVSFHDVLAKIQYKFSLEMNYQTFKNIEKRADIWKTTKPRKKMDLDFYKNKQYMGLYTEPELNLMRLHLNDEIVKRNGYKIF